MEIAVEAELHARESLGAAVVVAAALPADLVTFDCCTEDGYSCPYQIFVAVVARVVIEGLGIGQRLQLVSGRDLDGRLKRR
jgi:hypothetical protein